MSVLAMESRWVIYGLMGGRDAPGEGQALLGALLRKRASIRATTLRTRPKEYKVALCRRFAAEALPLIASGQLKVVIDSTFPAERVGEAYARLLANRNVGKIVLQFAE